MTTNDNLDALRFYQRRGFVITGIRLNALENSRRMKSTIPETGDYGIPLGDEIELEFINSELDPKYDFMGKTYNFTRAADYRITKFIVDILELNKHLTIVDIGAGTGNYSLELAKKGFKVVAIEPSRVMRDQAKIHKNLQWINGIAEKIPVESEYADGVICILATHHFNNLTIAFKEMKRILKPGGILLIFTADPRLIPEGFWMNEYFGEIILDAYKVHPPIEEIKKQLEQIFENTAKMIDFPLPDDLEDKFFFSGWKHPEWYLDKTFCKGISSLASLSEKELDGLLQKLKEDLSNGLWKQKHGDILGFDSFDAGYYFITIAKNK